jgi:ribonuclease BN (tRNA processing enzyme)
MKVTVVASSPEEPEGRQYLSSFIVENRLAVDAGSLALHRSPAEQLAVCHVLLTHSHADHIGSLPIFLENTSYGRLEPVGVHGPRATIGALRQHVFNDQIWPNLSRLDTPDRRLVDLKILEPEVVIEINGLRITPVAVSHTVPTFGYIVDDGTDAVVFGGDSGPTDRIWELARRTSRLRAAFIECTFPSAMSQHALRTGHLTPIEMSAEIKKLPPGTAVVAVHIRVAFSEEIRGELVRLRCPQLEIGRGGVTYEF